MVGQKQLWPTGGRSLAWTSGSRLTKKPVFSALMTSVLAACVSTASLQLSHGDGSRYRVSGRSYKQIWQAATTAMSTDMHSVKSQKTFESPVDRDGKRAVWDDLQRVLGRSRQ